MEGTPPMSSYEDETGVKLIIIIIIIICATVLFLKIKKSYVPFAPPYNLHNLQNLQIFFLKLKKVFKKSEKKFSNKFKKRFLKKFLKKIK